MVAIQRTLSNYIELDFYHERVLRLDSNWDWVVYHLSDALWAFSIISFVLLSSQKDSRNIKLLYLFVSIVIMLILEITVGTFDWLDLVAMFIGSCLSITVLSHTIRP